jgi:molybdenum cofactor cytidylyltransferase
MSNTAIIILAAGNSSRLGRPKQLLPYQDKTLLSHVVTQALKTPLQPVVVVTGAYHAEIEASLLEQSVVLTYNVHWESGMGSGIVVGLRQALSIEPGLRGVIVAVCDQPYISSTLFQALIVKWASSGKGLIACAYSGTMGTPVLFGHRYFKDLSALSGDAGARQLLKRYPDDVATVPFPQGNIDIDTEDDFEALQLKK